MDNVPLFYKPDHLTHKKPELVDNWEKLEEDVYHLVTKGYLDSPDENVNNIILRAKALARVKKETW